MGGTEIVLAAAINGIFALLVLFIGKKLNGKIDRVSDSVTKTHEEVKNSHKSNLRDDIDGIRGAVKEMRDENTSKFLMTNSLIAAVQETQARQGRDLISLRNDVGSYIESRALNDKEVREELLAFRKTLKRPPS